MFWCCCLRLHRHQLHLASYGCVSFSLILAGIIFTVFAVFQKDSQIGKVWLAGPVLIVVGSVLCGKVMIDWGPAMERGRAGSADSRFIAEFGYSNILSGKANLSMASSPQIAHHLKIPAKGHPRSPTGFGSATPSPPFAHIQNASPSLSNSAAAGPGQFGFDCITYGPGVPALPPLSPTSPFKSPLEMKEMADKTTQLKNEGCERCATLWSILDRKRTTTTSSSRDDAKSPKVIGKFVFSELNNGGPSQQQQPNYGTLNEEQREERQEEERTMLMASGGHPLLSTQQNHNANINPAGGGRGTKRRLYSQGETLIMNERSFLI